MFQDDLASRPALATKRFGSRLVPAPRHFDIATDSCFETPCRHNRFCSKTLRRRDRFRLKTPGTATSSVAKHPGLLRCRCYRTFSTAAGSVLKRFAVVSGSTPKHFGVATGYALRCFDVATGSAAKHSGPFSGFHSKHFGVATGFRYKTV